MIFVNYKTYEEGSGERAVELTKIIEEVAHESQVRIIPVVQAGDIREVAAATTLEVWAQKIDPVDPGAHTGSIVAEAVIEDGARGTFLNHSEAKFVSFEELAEASDKAKATDLKTLIFASNLEDLKNICALTPTYIAYEPAELIGSVTNSVAKAQPEIISEAADIARVAGIPLIVGAGVSSMDDVKKSIELGASGVAIATAVVKAPDPRTKLLELVEGFK